MKFISLILGLLSLTSCAYIIHSQYQTVIFNSQPKGAKILIDGKDYGVTPAEIILRRKGREKDDRSGKTSYNVEIQLEGYLPYELKITRKVDGWIAGNIIFGGLLGLIVDGATGAMYKLTPEQVVAQMKNTSTGSIDTKDDKLFIAVTMEINSSWEKIGELELEPVR